MFREVYFDAVDDYVSTEFLESLRSGKACAIILFGSRTEHLPYQILFDGVDLGYVRSETDAWALLNRLSAPDKWSVTTSVWTGPVPEPSKGRPRSFREGVLHLSGIPVPVHFYVGQSWDGRIDDTIEAQSETAIVSYERPPSNQSSPGSSFQVWVDGCSVSYCGSQVDAISYLEAHLGPSSPKRDGSGAGTTSGSDQPAVSSPPD